MWTGVDGGGRAWKRKADGRMLRRKTRKERKEKNKENYKRGEEGKDKDKTKTVGKGKRKGRKNYKKESLFGYGKEEESEDLCKRVNTTTMSRKRKGITGENETEKDESMERRR